MKSVKSVRGWKLIAAAGSVLVIGGAGAYGWLLHDRPQPLGLISPVSRTPAPSPADVDPLSQVCRRPALPAGGTGKDVAGLWVIQPASLAGYRAHEKFAGFPSPHEAVARTDRVSGWLLVAGDASNAQIVTGCVAVQLDSFRSVDHLPGFNTADRDEITRDLLNVSAHPYGVFEPYPASLNPDIALGSTVRMPVSGALELNGTSLPATFPLELRLASGQVAAAGRTTVNARAYGIEVPQAADFVVVDPQITLEISLVLLKP
jgi:hypothetical protein